MWRTRPWILTKHAAPLCFFFVFFYRLCCFYTHYTRANSVFYLHHWHNAGNHSIPLDSDGLPVTRQRPTHQTEVEWLLVTQPAKCRLWSCDLTKKAQFRGDIKDVTAVDAIIRSCLGTTWDDRHVRTHGKRPRTHTHTQIFWCIMGVSETATHAKRLLKDFLFLFRTTTCFQPRVTF